MNDTPTPGPTPGPTPAPTPGATILVVDDDRQLREYLKELLEGDGYAIRLAANGDEALEACREARPDLVLTDLVMPGKDGLELLLELKRSDPDLPVVAISGGSAASADNYLRVAKVIGAADILEKPFRGADLSAAVRRVLGTGVHPDDPPPAGR